MPATILSDNGVSSGSAGIKTTGSNDGILALQTTTAGGTATTAVTIGTDQSVTFAQSANLPNTFGFKNRIINGAMMIDQRNAGASVTPTFSEYTLDRWQMDIALASKFSVQQVSDAPSGFISSIRLTVVSSYTPAAGNAMFLRQNVEGLNVSDFAWGTASAQSISVSFWVKSSVTGTYSVAVGNSANNYHYITTYTVSSASTWEYKTISIPGPTAGTWLTTNGVGLRLKFDIGSGSNYNGTANVWSAADVGRTSGSVVLGSNSGATWQITGVQLERGSAATSFDFRPYGTELMLCQRYYEVGRLYGSAYFWNVTANANDYFDATYCFKQTKRASPTITSTNLGTGTIATQVTDVNAAAFRRTGFFSSPLSITLTASAEL